MKLLDSGALATSAEAAGRLDLATDADLDEVTPRLADARTVVVSFPGFRDGRGFSIAAVLRARGFRGELIARGPLLPDQARHLARSGFDAVELRPDADPAEWRRELDAYSGVYQPAQDGEVPIWRRRHLAAPPLRVVETLEAKVARLNAELRDAPAEAIVRAVVAREFPGRVALLTSFGAEAAVGLHLVSQADPATPVLFLDTERHFEPTLHYRDTMTARLGLADVRSLKPLSVERDDPRGDLWSTHPDQCCVVRKVTPLQGAMAGFDALITGRKRFHGGARMRLPVFEVVDGTVRVNPLAGWTAPDVEAYYLAHDLPRHPLVAAGYGSIGCWTCTRPAANGAELRAGRWSGVEKTECGIHLPAQWAAGLQRRQAS